MLDRTEKQPTLSVPSTGRYNPVPSAVRLTDANPDSRARRILIAFPQAVFRGEGLWLWGADETTLIHQIKSGNQFCFILSHTGIPGLYFEAGLPFAEFEALVVRERDGSHPWVHERLKSLPRPDPHQRIRIPTAEIGNSLVIDVEGPLSHAVVWGLSIL